MQDASALLQLDKPKKHEPVLVQTAAQVYKKISEVAAGSEELPDWVSQAAEAAQGVVASASGGDVAGQIADTAEKFGVDNVTEVLGDISDTVSVVDGQVGADEYIGKMQGLVRDFSDQARSRAAIAMAGLEAQEGAANKTFIISAAATIVETGEVAENMAEQFLEQVQAGRDEVVEVLAGLDSSNETDEAVISERLQPTMDFLVELLGGTSQLMGSSLEGLRASREMAPSTFKGAAAKPVALFLLVPGDLAADARQSLDDADATLVVMSAFAERLRASVQQTSNLGDRFIDASGDSAVSLQRDLVDAARQVSVLLSDDFVAEESARLLAETRSAASRFRAAPLLAGLVLAALTA